MNADPPASGGSAPLRSVPVLEWLRSIHPELCRYAVPMQEWWQREVEFSPVTTASIVMYCACPLGAPALYARRRLEDIADYTCMAKQHRAAFVPAAEELIISHRDIPQPLPAGIHPSVREWLRSILPELEASRYAKGLQRWWHWIHSYRDVRSPDLPDHWTEDDLLDLIIDAQMEDSHADVFFSTAELQLLGRPFDRTGGDQLILPAPRQPAAPAPPAEAEGTAGAAPTSGGLPRAEPASPHCPSQPQQQQQEQHQPSLR